MSAGALLSGCTTGPQTRPGREEQPQSRPASADQLRFALIGDTGVAVPKGHLAATSTALAARCKGDKRCAFLLLAGDNIYPKGAVGDPAQDEPVFKALFADPFAAFAANNPGAPILVALGNHDWYNSREGALAQVAFHERTRPFYMQGNFYSQRVSDAFGGVEIFVVDSEMLLAPEQLTEYKKAENGAMVASGRTKRGGTQNALPVTAREKAQLAWLEQALAGSEARWKFILAHHPLWQGRADSKFSQSIRLRALLLPLACRYADAFFAGHQHSIEVHEDDCSTVAAMDGRSYAPLPVIVSGAGAKARSVTPDFQRFQSGLYPENTVRLSWGKIPGFVIGAISDDRLMIEAIAVGDDGARGRWASFTYEERSETDYAPKAALEERATP